MPSAAERGYETHEEKVARERREEQQEIRRYVRMAAKVVGGVILGIMLLVVAWKLIGPQLRLYQASTEKKAIIAEARARADAAKYEADRAVEVAIASANAERERAKGVADAQATIAATITPEYVQWLYVDQMDRMAENGKATIIYVPTEGGIPILEAGRMVETPQQ